MEKKLSPAALSIIKKMQQNELTESVIYEEIAKTLKRSYDPRIPFIITALVLFLLDIAVRKFKFKWPHEIIRDAKAKKLLQERCSAQRAGKVFFEQIATKPP